MIHCYMFLLIRFAIGIDHLHGNSIFILNMWNTFWNTILFSAPCKGKGI